MLFRPGHVYVLDHHDNLDFHRQKEFQALFLGIKHCLVRRFNKRVYCLCPDISASARSPCNRLTIGKRVGGDYLKFCFDDGNSDHNNAGRYDAFLYCIQPEVSRKRVG